MKWLRSLSDLLTKDFLSLQNVLTIVLVLPVMTGGREGGATQCHYSKVWGSLFFSVLLSEIKMVEDMELPWGYCLQGEPGNVLVCCLVLSRENHALVDARTLPTATLVFSLGGVSEAWLFPPGREMRDVGGVSQFLRCSDQRPDLTNTHGQQWSIKVLYLEYPHVTGKGRKLMS